MRLSHLCRSVLVATALAGCTAPIPTPVAVEPGKPVFDQGTSITVAAQVHLDAAALAAGTDFPGVLLLCNQARPKPLRLPLPGQQQIGAAEHDVHPDMVRVFDNLYSIRTGNVNAWLLSTSAGLVLIDTLNNDDDWTQYAEPAMRRFGLRPEDIHTVIVTHGHGDHYGGAGYLQRRYHAHVYLSAADWVLMQLPRDKPYFGVAPQHDRVVHDGDTLRFGTDWVRLAVTPGHTEGTVSVLMSVHDGKQRHVVALWGGTGYNFVHSHAGFQRYAQSAARFAALARDAGADVPLSNHPDIDNLPLRLQRLADRAAGAPHPFVLGANGIDRFLKALSECALAYDEQFTPPSTDPKPAASP